MFTPQVYDAWDSIQQEKYEEILKTMGKDFFNSILKKRVLDIGSGSSYFERFLVSKEFNVSNVVSLDIRKDFMKKVDTEELVIGDGNKLPFKKESFDAIVSIDTMHLIKDKDFSRVLKKGGIVLFTVFFNDSVYEERKNMIKNMLDGFEIMFEFEFHKKEKEYVIIATKK
jgi:SAM-dependent methyltransferase